MPVNTASLKAFAPAMRRQLLEGGGPQLLHRQPTDTLATDVPQIADLREQEASRPGPSRSALLQQRPCSLLG